MGKSRKHDRKAVLLLQQAAFPVYLLDRQRCIQFCNQACADWGGVETDQILGRRCDYHSTDAADLDALAAGLCPSVAALSGQRDRGTVAVPVSPNQFQRRSAEFYPLAADATAGVLVIVAPADLPPDDGAAEPAADDPDALHDQIRRQRLELAGRFQFEHLMGVSSSMHRVRQQVKLAIQSSANAVIVGPPGSGRERIARTIGESSSGPDDPVIPLDCSLLDAELVETTVEALLRRAADRRERTVIRLLLLEADQLPPDAQRVLRGFLAQNIAMQLLSTSRVDPLELASQDRFSHAVADALGTLVVGIPPLSERLEDVPVLAQVALERLNARGDHQIGGLTNDATSVLSAYAWHGNADELFELMAEAHGNAQGPLITQQDLPERFQLAADAERHPARVEESIVLDEYLAGIERELIQRALGRSNGNRAAAARLLGISRGRLLRRIGALQLDS